MTTNNDKFKIGVAQAYVNLIELSKPANLYAKGIILEKLAAAPATEQTENYDLNSKPGLKS